MTSAELTKLRYAIDNALQRSINNIQSNEDLLESVRVSSTLEFLMRKPYFVDLNQKLTEINNLLDYKNNSILLDIHNRFLQRPITVIPYDAYDTYDIKCENYQEALKEAYSYVKGEASDNLTLSFLAQWYIAEGKNKICFYVN